MRLIDKLSHLINHWVEYALFALGLSMALIVANQVFFRYALNQSLFWSEELVFYKTIINAQGAEFFEIKFIFISICSRYFSSSVKPCNQKRESLG